MAPAHNGSAAKSEDALARRIGKLVIGGIISAVGIACLWLLYYGFDAHIATAASSSTDFIAIKTAVDTLQTEHKILQATANTHTEQLKESERVQRAIFDGIKAIGNDVHTIDNKVSALNQKVDDQSDQLKELRSRK